jgi:acetyltransferase-like isoleucine patch superfamily enzyme
MNLSRAVRWGTEFLGEQIYASIRGNESVLAARLRQRFLGTSCRIDSSVVVTNKKNFKCGTGCALYHGTYILNTAGNFSMGNRSHLGVMCYVNVGHGNLIVGDDVAIGPHTSIIVYSNHYEAGKRVTDVRLTQDVRIGNNVFIGAHCTILPGAEIADHVVIGAGSVVKGTLESNAIYAGAPCRKLREGWYGELANER